MLNFKEEFWWHSLFIIIFCLFFLIFFTKLAVWHWGFLGKVIVETNFKKDTALVHPLGPKERIIWTSEELKVISDPIYFPIKFTTDFKKIKLILVYKASNLLKLAWGPQIGEGFVYDLKEIINLSNESEDSWKIVEEEWEVSPKFKFDKNQQVKFMISAPNLSADKFLLLKSLKVELIK